MRRRQLPHRMPHQHIRPNPPRLQQPEQRHLERHQRHLSELGAPQHLSRAPTLVRVPALAPVLVLVLVLVLGEHQLPQRPPQLGIRHRAHRVQRLREHRERRIQLPAHPRPLRPLAREQEPGLPATHLPDRTVPGQFPQCTHRAFTVGGRHHRTPFERRPRAHQRQTDIGQVHLRTRRHVRGQPSGLRPQRLHAAARHHQRHHRRHSALGHGRRLDVRRRPLLDRGRLLDDHVGVRAAQPERRHARPARMTVLRPLPRLGQQLHPARRPVHMGRRLIGVQRLRQQAVPHRLHHLDDAADARGGLGMPDVGLDRAQPERPVLRPILAVGRQQRLRLDRVTERRTRTVALHRVHLRRRHTGVGQRLPDHPLLRQAVRRGQPVGGAVGVDRRTTHHRQHRMPVAARVRQPLHQQHARTLGPAGAVRGIGERLAPAVGGQAALPAEGDERRRCRHHHHTAGQREGALPLAQRLDREVQRHQRRRARRVHRHRRPLQTQRVGHPAGDHRRRARRAHVRFGDFRSGVQQVLVVLDARAGEDAHLLTADGSGVDARPLERLPADLQHEALLRVGGECLPRADLEEVGVEVTGSVDEAALANVAPPVVLGVRGDEPVDVPASVGREPRDGVHPTGHQPPQVVRRLHPARITAGHAHDRDRLQVLALHLTQALAGLVQVRGDLLQVFKELFVVRHGSSRVLSCRRLCPAPGQARPSSVSMKVKMSSAVAASSRLLTSAPESPARFSFSFVISAWSLPMIRVLSISSGRRSAAVSSS
ncbi:hypothetical protein PS9374_07177 [Planomonospora sphaerica]|uniref:Uncharacterized protein n=1 Tax=Planomonospora sphaerica TaxID=161355 RepID=A0A171DR07_9ACTN|nr:hypothetical protein PS9374_07177 [Planomonospora sphaerica]